MDFGSFLRQRQQKQLVPNENTGNASQDSWTMNRPYPDVGRDDRLGNDSIFFSGPSEVDSWNQQSDTYSEAAFYDQDVDHFGPRPPRGRRGSHGRNMRPPASSRGRGSFRGRFNREPGAQTWSHPADSFEDPSSYGEEGEFFQQHKSNRAYDGYIGGSDTRMGVVDNLDQGGNLFPEQVMDNQGPNPYCLGNKMDPQTNDQQGREMNEQTSSDDKNVDTNVEVEVKKKPAKQKIVKSEEEQKALEEFDIMKMNINWPHFCITKRMLIEASSVGKQPISNKRNYDINKLEFYCKLCDVQTVSAGNFHDHMVGKKHKMRAEQDVGSVDIEENPEEKFGEFGFVDSEVKNDNNDVVDDDDDDSDDGQKQKEENEAYERSYYENFNNRDVNIDWESNEITESMLAEASLETKVPKYENRCFDLFNLQFYCRLCDIQSTSTATFYDHLNGKKHKNKVTKEMNTEKATNEEEDERDEQGLTEKERSLLQEFDIFNANLNWEHYNITKEMLLEASTDGIRGLSQKRKKKHEIDITKLEFYCKLCASQMVSAGNFYDHLIGKKHKQAYHEHQKISKLMTAASKDRELLHLYGLAVFIFESVQINMTFRHWLI